MQQMRQTAIILAGTSDGMNGGIQNSLKLVMGDGPGCPSENAVAIVYMIRYKGVD